MLEALAVEGRPLEALRLHRAGRLSRFGGRSPRRDSPRAGIVSVARSRHRRRRVVQTRNRAGPREDRAVGRRARQREHRAAADSRASAQTADPPARHAGVVSARQGNHRSICRSRSSPSGTAAMCWSSRPSTAARFPASCTGRRPAAPVCFSSRSARSRSTTTSSRSKSRRSKRSAGSSWRSPTRSGRERPRCCAPSKPPPRSTCCRRARASRCSSAASSRRSRRTGRSSCRRRGIPLLMPQVLARLGESPSSTVRPVRQSSRA